jgi:hypothetical protein
MTPMPQGADEVSKTIQRGDEEGTGPGPSADLDREYAAPPHYREVNRRDRIWQMLEGIMRLRWLRRAPRATAIVLAAPRLSFARAGSSEKRCSECQRRRR